MFPTIREHSSTIWATVFDYEIPMSVRAAETSAEGSSLYVYDPEGNTYWQHYLMRLPLWVDILELK